MPYFLNQPITPKPEFIKAWSGGTMDVCQITIDGAALKAIYGSTYLAVMICGLSRPIDRMTDPGITVTGKYTLESRDIVMGLFADRTRA